MATDDVKYGEILGPETLGRDGASREARVRGGFWRAFRRAARVIPFADELVAAYFCALDPKTPGRVRATLLGALAYFVLPLDTIPDLIALVGFTDDAAVLLAAITMVRAHITPEHRAAAHRALTEQQP